MDLYAQIEDYLLGLAPLRAWPEAGAVLRRATAARDRNWRLPELACRAVGGSPAQALPGVAAVAAHQIGIVLVDDLLDADPRGWHQQVGAGPAANLALAFHAAATAALLNGPAAPEAHLGALRRLSAMALAVAHGQALDAGPVMEEAVYWQVIALKSGPFFGAALELGALLGGAPPATATGLYQLGQLIGEMIQLHDDLHDTLAAPAGPDWLMGRRPLPILFALTVAHPAQAEFAALHARAAEADALRAAQEILVRCGAVSYCVYHLQARAARAQAQLAALALPHPAGLAALLDELIEPVQGLLAEEARPG